MITEAGPLNLKLGAVGMTCKVHPTVLVTICESFIRRPANSARVIGTLLGNETSDNSIEIKACYAVPHEETDEQVQLDVPHHTTMLDLHQRVHPKHTVVGWFSTGLAMTGRDALIHAFYARGRASACGVKHLMHLAVDTELTINDRVSIKAHIGRKLSLGGTEVAAEFVEVPTAILTGAPEGLALDALCDEKCDNIPADSENLRKSIATLQKLIADTHAYVADVCEGRREPDVTIGRYLSDIIGTVPCTDKAEFKKLFEGCTQDILLVMYLSNLVRSHLSLAEKLGTFALALA